MLMGQCLSQAAVIERMEVTYTQSYGSEMRGGTANCAVVISDDKIGSPIIGKTEACVVMNLPSLTLFAAMVRRGGVLVINSSLVKQKPDRKDIRCIYVPATEIASKLGTSMSANLVSLGAFIEATQIVKPTSLLKALKLVFLKFCIAVDGNSADLIGPF